MTQQNDRKADLETLASLKEKVDDFYARQTSLTEADRDEFFRMEKTLAEITKRYGGDTESILRRENRIQDDPAILTKLGFKGELPSIPAELLEECARTSGTLVLKFKTSILDYQSALNKALGSDKEHLRLYVEGRAETLATTNDLPNWINVPNTVRVDTLGMSKVRALNHVPGSATCDPMDTVLMLGFNNLQAGEQLAGFTNKLTFTNRKDTVVGSNDNGIGVDFFGCYDFYGCFNVGLAPRLAPESKN